MLVFVAQKCQVTTPYKLKDDNRFLGIVCPLLRQYAHEERGNVILSIISQAYSIARGNAMQPVLAIIIAAALRVCGYNEESYEQIKLVLLAALLGGVILWAYPSLGSRRKATKRRKKTRSER
jgi:hypothetical protein